MRYHDIMPNDVLELRPNNVYGIEDRKVYVESLRDRKGCKVGLVIDIQGRVFQPRDFKGRIGTWT